jgi:hypothetical protein
LAGALSNTRARRHSSNICESKRRLEPRSAMLDTENLADTFIAFFL